MPRLIASHLLPTDPGVYHRLRWHARAWTAVAGVVLVVVVVDLVARATSDSDDVRKSAAWAFFQGGLLVVVLAPVLWFQWRRSFRARPRRLHVDDGEGALTGVPELDVVARDHPQFGPGASTPRRW